MTQLSVEDGEECEMAMKFMFGWVFARARRVRNDFSANWRLEDVLADGFMKI